MGEQVKELFNWARRRKILASFFVAFTLVVGIMIGSVISGRVSAMKTFSGTNATPLSVPDPIPSASSFSGIVNRVEPAVVNIATTQVLERKPNTRSASCSPTNRILIRTPTPTRMTTRCRTSSTVSLTVARTLLPKPSAASVPA